MEQKQTQTAVSLNRAELGALIDLFRIAQMRLSTAEQLYYDGLIARFDQELSTQEQDIFFSAVPPPDVSTDR